jgi:hypothetical protein
MSKRRTVRALNDASDNQSGNETDDDAVRAHAVSALGAG